ncbi:class I SAM-dependent methyltransferase [Candidatus Clavichlamydia salmonicola]|uniref:class I SAM-dependent methyltransferase n=1 Tax=Candidatus Clavichlamydia salmonicola TaxID=469812 RepID=UPI001890F356|nr:class I SAM-dependent methyltransferase [Candidatus Clavichlamydia salmonicola]
MNYSLLDSGAGKKLEQFGSFTLVRPASKALWAPHLSKNEWHDLADAIFMRQGEEGYWEFFTDMPSSWTMSLEDVLCSLKMTPFGHVGLFPEHAVFWPFIRHFIKDSENPNPKILNLFAYTGGASIAAAQAGAWVVHVDASHAAVRWARENAQLNEISPDSISWVVDDVMKFLKRQYQKGYRYDGIILDPPTFGRGSSKEIFKIEHQLSELLHSCAYLLNNAEKNFILVTSHTPGYTPLLLSQLLKEAVKNKGGYCQEGEIWGDSFFKLPAGVFAKWVSR